ncbi:MAG: hypothetical protein U0234_15220 [Sandaracinus sp.]
MAAPLVLLVEDRPLVMRSLSKAARAVGWQPIEAATIEEARFVLERGPLNTVISDYALRRGETGLELLALARDLQPSSLRVLSSASVPPGLDEAIASGLVQVFLPKPYGISALLRLARTPTS